eukprot:CAMPEP_0202769544 /NCGR_PEP_ID=MMETSP1388-20130828/36917_1 /ASSEMBLY_ACC=CAM_ASM_000864 /TAXON_ID=37098 /ORGANISM="Isochrysis sp, Strain CCMP1244" /LENGTH=130 /DNA_ID=CAMNT_0049438333 /DNA_START=1 /DNA_END=393 /DNA_ORIENTATION=-
MKLYIVGMYERGLYAFSIYANAVAFIDANEGSYLYENSGPEAAKGQTFCEVNGVAVGDIVHVPKFFSDSSGEEYIGGAFSSQEEAHAASGRMRTWRIPEDEKKGSGEVSLEEAGIDAVQGAIGGWSGSAY